MTKEQRLAVLCMALIGLAFLALALLPASNLEPGYAHHETQCPAKYASLCK